MPLSKPARRKHIHTREIRCQGFERDDGLWDIEGSMVDTKSYSFSNADRGGITAGEPIHHMLIRLTVDNELVVHAAEAATEQGPYFICGDVTEAFSALAGVQIGPGWRKAVKKVMGGIHGCTHLRDLLLGPVAVTAFQTVYPARQMRDSGQAKDGTTARPRIIDTCHALRSDGPVVERQWPAFFEPGNNKKAG